MKVALVHDWLNTKIGGGEQVLLELASLYPDADIYTLLFNQDNYSELIDANRIHSSFLQRFPRWFRQHSRYLVPLAPIAIEQFDLSEYDVVISTSSAFAKGVTTRPETLHICYCYSPMRFVWDYWPRYLDEQRVGPIRRVAIRLLTSRLRLWDYYSSARVDKWIAISQTVANRIRKYYHQPSVVIHPPVDLEHLRPNPNKKGDYYVTLASLTPYKRIDLAILACNQLNRRLIVISDGSDRARLEAMAGPTIEFTGRVPSQKKAELLAGAKALLFPNEEDFGIAPIEAMGSATPVIAYNRGGLTETIGKKAGLFFDQPTSESLSHAIKRADTYDFNATDMIAQAKRFSTKYWRSAFNDAVEESYKSHVKANRL